MHSRELPIYALEAGLADALGAVNRVLIRAPTGSGKSTQIPQMLLDRGLAGRDGWEIVVLQPRRIAARLLAARVAAERDVPLGGEVGYQVRFEQAAGPRTRLRYVTEGILLRQMLADPELRKVDAIVFDEFHERHLYGDITLARALELQARRPELKVLVMSATLAVEPLEAYLAPCRTLHSEGRMHPVAIEYLPRAPAEREAVWDLAAEAFERLAADGLDGDTLVFMPGAYEIQRTLAALQTTRAAHGLRLLPLHGELPSAEQDAVVAPGGGPRVVVATNVAETSLTIPGVRAVIDSGLARIPRYDPQRGINTLRIERISRASADQRAGRAGRTAPGRCVRLWTERDHHARALEETPEIRRLDLAEVALTLKASGVPDLRAFRWLDPPAAGALDRAETLLRDLGALDAAGAVTPLGRRMLSFPVHPRYARMLIAAGDVGAVDTVAAIAALTQGRGLLVRAADGDARGRREDLLGDRAESDFFLLLRAWRYADRCGYDVNRCRALGIHAQAARQVKPLYEAFLRIAREEGLPAGGEPPEDEAVQRCILTGFSDHLARRLDEGTLRCELTHGRRGQLSRDSVVRHAPLIVAADVQEIEGRDVQTLLSLATSVKLEWLRELFPGEVIERTTAVYDRGAKRVLGERQEVFRELVLESRRSEQVPPDAAAALLAAEVRRGDLRLETWNEAVDQWILRLNFLARHAPDLGLPPIGPAERQTLVEQLCLGCVTAREVRERPALPVVQSWVSEAQRALVERHAPAKLALPGGHDARVTYAAEGPPRISRKIQDLYGLKESPRIALGRVAVTVEILGPNFRPVQTTQDLAGFWRDTYPAVKQELRRKYPKHEWR